METVIFWLRVVSNWLETHNGAITAIATAFIAFFTIALAISTKKLWRESRIASRISYRAARAAKKSADVSEQTLIATERAYVFVKAIRHEPIIDTVSARHFVRAWNFIPVFENSGSTPTKHSIMHVSFAIENEGLPDAFQFPDLWLEGMPKRYSRFFIGPKAEKWSAPIEIHTVDLEAVKNRGKRIFIWGWIDYNDVLKGTARHRTEFGLELFVKGDPAIPTASFTFQEFRDFNGADDDCYRKPKPYEDMQL